MKVNGLRAGDRARGAVRRRPDVIEHTDGERGTEPARQRLEAPLGADEHVEVDGPRQPGGEHASGFELEQLAHRKPELRKACGSRVVF